MKIIDIETHEACVPLQSWNAKAIPYYQDWTFSYRTIYVLKTDNGLKGPAELSGRERGNEQEWKDRPVGTNPADWLANRSLPI